MTEAHEALIAYFKTLSEEQAARALDHLPLLKQIAGMSEHKQVFLETFVEQVFGRAGA